MFSIVEQWEIRNIISLILAKLFNYSLNQNSQIIYSNIPLIILIYKEEDTYYLKSYSPISLINTDAKILNKILAISLQNIARALIFKSQYGFIKSRNIFDNIWSVI